MRVRLTIDKRMYLLLEEEAEKYSIPVNRLINQIISSSEELEPRFYKIEKDNKVKDVKVNAENRDIWNKQLRVHGEYSKSEFVERFPELSLFYRLFSPLNSEMICIFPYFCPYAESAREIREIFS